MTSRKIIDIANNLDFIYDFNVTGITGNNSRITATSYGEFLLYSTQNSTNSSTGSVVLYNGGLSINNTTNASSLTQGGALTIAGGASIQKDILIGGKLGISISNPSYTLDVSGSTRISNTLLATFNSNTIGNIFTTGGNVGINNTNPIAPLSFSSTLGQKITLWGSSTSTNYGIGVQSGQIQLHTDLSSGNIAFGYGSSTSFSELMRIGNGCVGISTTAPTTTLDVVGTGRISTSLTTGALYSTNLTSTNIVATNVSSATLNLSTGLTSANAQITNLNATTSTIATLLNTNMNSTNVTSATLNLSTGLTSASVRVTSNLIALGNSNTLGNLYTTGGNIGIGTTSPSQSYLLDINGSTRILTGTSTSLIVSNYVNNNVIQIKNLSSTGNSAVEYLDYNDAVKLYTGYANPSSNNDGLAASSYIMSTNAVSLKLIAGNQKNSPVILNALDNSVSITCSTNSVDIYTGALNIAGGVGITNNLYVGGNLNVSGTLTVVNITTTNLMDTNLTAGIARITTSLSALGNSNTIGSLFTTSGNVGIGTTSPAATLDVIGTGKITTSLTTGALYSTNLTSTNIVATNVSSATLSLSSLTITNLNATTSTIATLLNTNLNSTNITSATLNLSTGLTSASAQITNENVTTSTIATLLNTNMSSTNITSSTLNISGMANVGTLLINASISNTGGSNGLFFRTGATSAAMSYNCSIMTYDHNADVWSDGLSINAYDGISFCTGSNTRNEKMRINVNGNVGIGTTSPAYKLSLYGSSANISGPHTAVYTSDQPLYPTFQHLNWSADNSGLSFDMYFDGSSWRTSNTTGGFQIYKLSNRLNFTYALGSQGSALSASTAMVVGSTGNIGIGTVSPANTLDVSGTGRISTSLTTGALYSTNLTSTNIVATNLSSGTLSLSSLTITNLNATTSTIATLINTNMTSTNIVATNLSSGTLSLSSLTITNLNATTSTIATARITSSLLALGNSNTMGTIFTTGGSVGMGVTGPSYSLHVDGDICATGDVISFGTISDRRLKQNVQTIENEYALEIIKSLNPVFFEWKDDIFNKDKRLTKDVGFIAQEIEPIIPYAVSEYKYQTSVYKNMKHERIIPYLVSSIKSLEKIISEQQIQIDRLLNK